MRGRHHTPEAIAKMRAAQKGKKRLIPRSPETRARQSTSMMGKLVGRKQSPEHIAKRVAARKGKKNVLPFGACAICGRERPLYKDHCHVTGERRDLLCIRCNTGLGQFGDDPALLEAAARYVQHHRLKRAL